jgi:hypothetical protein
MKYAIIAAICICFALTGCNGVDKQKRFTDSLTKADTNDINLDGDTSLQYHSEIPDSLKNN